MNILHGYIFVFVFVFVFVLLLENSKCMALENFSSCAKVLPFWLGFFSNYSKDLHFVFHFLSKVREE